MLHDCVLFIHASCRHHILNAAKMLYSECLKGGVRWSSEPLRKIVLVQLMCCGSGTVLINNLAYEYQANKCLYRMIIYSDTCVG